MKHSDDTVLNDEMLKRLASLYIQAQPYLGDYSWPWEEQRWHEMIVCAIVSAGCSPELARLSLQVLQHVHLDTPKALLELSSESSLTIKEVFTRSGMLAQEADRSIKALRVAAAVCLKHWEGRPQLFLRKVADSAATELTQALQSEGMSPADSHTLAILWLQNVLNAPLLAVSSEAVRSFCESEGVSHQQLVAAADHVGLNVAVLEEVLALHHDSRSADGFGSESDGNTENTKRQAASKGKRNKRSSRGPL